MSQRVLKGMAIGLAETFISRNNDVLGYWGIGQLYREAQEQSVSEVTLDLISNCSHPSNRIANIELAHYRSYAANLLSCFRMSLANLSEATINIKFGTYGACSEPQWHSHGDPFVCTVTLRSSRGRIYSAMRAGCAAPHNPSRELRSARTYAL